MEIIKEKILERKGDKQKTIAIQYRKNDDKQENLDNTLHIQFDKQIANKVSDIGLSN